MKNRSRRPTPTQVHQRWIFLALLSSFAIHLLIWLWFTYIRLPHDPLAYQDDLKLRKFKLERVEMVSKPIEAEIPPPDKPSEKPYPAKASLAPLPETRNFSEILKSLPTSPTLPAGSPPVPDSKPHPTLGETDPASLDSSLQSLLETEIQATLQKPKLTLAKPLSSGRPIVRTPGASVPPRTPSNTEIGLPTEAQLGPLQPTLSGDSGSGGGGPGNLEDYFGPGGLPITTTPPASQPIEDLVPKSLLQDPVPSTQKFESINPLLKIDLFTAERKRENHPREGYFLIRISAKPNPQLQIVPRDLYFVIDISSSMGQARLKASSQTILYAIEKLNPDDRFKIFAFRDKLTSYSPEWILAKSIPMKDIRQWLSQLDTGGVTDFYEGIRPLLDQPRSKNRAALALIFSDGIPTTGLVDSTQIISEWTEENGNKISTFTLSSGTDVNSFLLDFLSYGNQGRLKLEVKTENALSAFSNLIEQIQDPLLLDPRFRFAGIDPDQVYPKDLPHLYQESPILLFGRYHPDKDRSISLQVLGENANKTKELLVKLDLPQTPTGPDTIPSTWARQRIYHLLGRMTRSRGPQSTIFDEVRQLSDEYKVEIPSFREP